MNKEVSPATQTQIGSFTITSGIWLLIGFMDWNASQDCMYLFGLNSRNIRANAISGGGVNNCSIANITSETTTFQVYAYHAGSTVMTARCTINAVKIG